uniref:Nuclear receptor domain-containing protein n=1 Tax=Panagrellus redivivus TaxID=6233 RepID=A0A7E5A0V2_PANRE
MHPMINGATLSATDICLVCGSLAKGLHFQVNSCRACAAFYRRSVKSKLVYRCQRGTGRCDLSIRIKGKPMCRYCRMKKCADIGMRIDADMGHESTSSPPESETVADEVPEEYVLKGGVVQVEGKRIIYDVKPLIHLIKEAVIKNNVQPIKGLSGVTLSPLQRMVHEVSKFIAQRTPKACDVQVVSEMRAESCIHFQEQYLLKLAHLVTSCEYFVRLEDDQKFPLFRHFWGSFQQIERAYQTLTAFGYETNDFRMIIGDKQAIDMDNTKFILGEADSDEIKKLFTPLRHRVFGCLMNPLRSLKPSIFEIAYMAINFLWTCFELNNIKLSTTVIAEEVLERSANELHNYYVYEMKLPNYAARHAVLMRLISVIESIIRSKKDVMILMRLFNILEDDFFDSELVD